MTSFSYTITTNQFIPRVGGGYTVTIPAAAITSQFNTVDVGCVRCYRYESGIYKQVVFYHEVTTDGDVIFHFDEVFEGKLVVSTDS